MSRFHLTRRAGTLTLAVAAGALAGAAPAVADVTVSPASAVQGDGANLTFTMTNSASSPITRVRLALPADTPIAEVYPLSAEDWAPQITQRTLSTPLISVHGGTPVTETTSAITWTAVRGHEIAPGGSAQLSVAVGPLPELSRMRFQVQATYADGSAGPALTPPELTLTPGTTGAAAGHGDAHGAAGDGDTAPAGEAAPEPDRGRNLFGLAGWVAAALVAAGSLLVVRRSRGRQDRNEPEAAGTSEAGADQDTTREPVGAGTWRYRG